MDKNVYLAEADEGGQFHLLRFNEASRDELLDEVWGYDALPTKRTVDVHMAQLRQKIETNPREPQFILTLYGFGCKFAG